MKIFLQSMRNSEVQYSTFEGMDESTIQTLMTELGHTSITVITEQTYLDNRPQI